MMSSVYAGLDVEIVSCAAVRRAWYACPYKMGDWELNWFERGKLYSQRRAALRKIAAERRLYFAAGLTIGFVVTISGVVIIMWLIGND